MYFMTKGLATRSLLQCGHSVTELSVDGEYVKMTISFEVLSTVLGSVKSPSTHTVYWIILHYLSSYAQYAVCVCE